MSSAVPTSNVEKQLAWERRHAPRAGAASLIGVLGLIVFFIVPSILERGAPNSSGLETLQRVAQPGAIGGLPSLRTDYFMYLHAHAALEILTGIGGFIGYLGLAWGAGFLAVATRARRQEFPRWGIYVPIVGGGVMAIGALVLQIGLVHDLNSFVATHHTVQDADDSAGRVVGFGGLVYQLGIFAMAVGLFLVSLNAMRAGLLTRLWGYMGVAAGVFLILIPVIPLVQFFWLAGLGAMLMKVWPGGPPPAWAAGVAIPWPSTRPPVAAKPTANPAAAGGPTPAQRKRKKRR